MARPLRVLLIVNHYPPDVNPSGRLMSQLAAGLRDLGLSVDVLTSMPHYDGFRISPAYRRRLVQRERVGEDLITRLWVFASGRKENMQHRLANYLSFAALATAAATVRSRKYDVVLANSGSFFTGIAAWIARVVRRAPFIYNVQDIYPDVPVRAGQLTNPRAIKGLESIERFMYRRAAHITVISQEQQRVLREKGVPAHKLTVIPNFVDTDFIRPLPRNNEFAQRHGLTDKFVVAHAGNLGFAYDFDALLQSAQTMRSDPGVVFLIIGDGVRKPEVAARIQERGLSNVVMLPFQPESDLPNMRAAVDVHLSLYRKGYAQSSLPSKLYEIMASGRPAVVSAEPGTDARSLIEGTNSGICIDPEDSVQLTTALRTIQRDSALALELGTNGRNAALRDFSRNVAAQRYAALLREVAER